MNQEIIERIGALLKEHGDNEIGRTILAALMPNFNEREALMLLDKAEGMLDYNNYLCEDEAMRILCEFVNFDGSAGARWIDPHALFNVVHSLGVETDVPGEYNRWAWYVTMNMVWSDEWGVLKAVVTSDDEVKTLARLTEARLLDADGRFKVREYFNL